MSEQIKKTAQTASPFILSGLVVALAVHHYAPDNASDPQEAGPILFQPSSDKTLCFETNSVRVHRKGGTLRVEPIELTKDCSVDPVTGSKLEVQSSKNGRTVCKSAMNMIGNLLTEKNADNTSTFRVITKDTRYDEVVHMPGGTESIHSKGYLKVPFIDEGIRIPAFDYNSDTKIPAHDIRVRGGSLVCSAEYK